MSITIKTNKLSLNFIGDVPTTVIPDEHEGRETLVLLKLLTRKGYGVFRETNTVLNGPNVDLPLGVFDGSIDVTVDPLNGLRDAIVRFAKKRIHNIIIPLAKINTDSLELARYGEEAFNLDNVKVIFDWSPGVGYLGQHNYQEFDEVTVEMIVCDRTFDHLLKSNLLKEVTPHHIDVEVWEESHWYKY